MNIESLLRTKARASDQLFERLQHLEKEFDRRMGLTASSPTD